MKKTISRKLTVILLAASALAVQARGQDPEMTVTPFAGEKWWGLFAGNSLPQPLAGPFEITDTDGLNGGGFYTPYMASSAGRYISGREGFSVVFDGGKFTINAAPGSVSWGRGGRTLRQGWLAMHHSDFKESGKYPPQELFTDLVYETQADFAFLQTADNILAYARRLVGEGFPPGIMVLAEGWRDISGYDFDRRNYPDPAGFVGEMHSLGFKVMLTVTPYIPAWGRDYAVMHRDGTLVTAADGKPLKMEAGYGAFAAVDMTVPEVASGMRDGLAALRDGYGIDGFRFDCSYLVEQIAEREEFTKEYLSAVYEAGAEFALTEFWPGEPRFHSDYAAAIRSSKTGERGYMSDVVTIGLACGPFTQVLPGFEELGNAGERQLARYAVISAMMPVGHVPFAPWKYGDTAAELKRVLDFRASLSKYMEKAYSEACKTVEPIVRPMEYMFNKDGFADCADQFMLGERYLIAPAVDDSPRRMVRLPRGTWRDMNGRKYKGPVVTEVQTDGYRMTWFELQ